MVSVNYFVSERVIIMAEDLKCRSGCGGCCIAPSITSFIPGMPNGKASGEPCINLNLETYSCDIWGQEDYPEFCRDFKPCTDVCGESREDALQIITLLEKSTNP